MNWTAARAAFQAELVPFYKSATMERWNYWLGIFERFCDSGPVGPHQVEAFHEWLFWTPGPHGRLYAPNTAYQAMRMVRAFLRWAATHEHLADNPARGLVLPRVLERPALPLDPDELARLLQATHAPGPLSVRNHAVVATLAGTGIPVRICARLDMPDAALDQAVLHLPNATQVPIGEDLVASLRRYLTFGRPCFVRADDENALFLGVRGNRLRAQCMWAAVATCARRAGLTARVTPRTLARSGAALDYEFRRRRIHP